MLTLQHKQHLHQKAHPDPDPWLELVTLRAFIGPPSQPPWGLGSSPLVKELILGPWTEDRSCISRHLLAFGMARGAWLSLFHHLQEERVS